MPFGQRWHSMRMRYEQRYEPADTREVTVRRVVNIFQRGTSLHPPVENYDTGFEDDRWFNDDPMYTGEECPRDNNYPSERYFNDNPNYVSFHRNSPPHHPEPPCQRPHYDRDDLRHQIRSRKNGRPGPYYNNRGRGHSQNREANNQLRHSQNVKGDWERSSGKKKSQPPAKKNVSPESDKGSAHAPKTKPVPEPTLPPSVPAEEPPQISSSTTEKPCDSVPEKEEAAPSRAEPETTQDQELKARRSEAIKAKALEIEKHYRQDCETFVTVVKMLVSKEPTLEDLLHSALNANLSEMKQNCFAALRHYLKELDEQLVLSDNTT
ncbi:periphilin-1-like [Hippocampus comes]|uniref:Periphilin-1-like n=1 Tax=Hippocampus comes TaxID=109280 RepID=A0A3Q3D725_HIPCM|nr:PREDICTED: periphilin-1-like [Hippocampus comes]